MCDRSCVEKACVEENRPVPWEKRERQGYTQEMLEVLQQEAFMEGYRYAIKVLQESIVGKEKAN